MIRPLLLALAVLPCLAAPLRADPVVDRVVDGLALPRLDAFAEATAALDRAAQAQCLAEDAGLRAAWNAAFDAWLPVQPFRAGPLEEGGRGLAIAFWPDPKGSGDRALGLLLAGDPAILASGAAYAQASVAARGLFGLEAMLYDPAFNGYGPQDPGCALTRAAAADLAALAAAAAQDWHDTYGPALKTAGAEGNTRFLSPREARQSLFTQALTQLEFDADQRLGRPLGTFERPRPLRAEARISGRSARNVQLSLAATAELLEALSDGTPELLPGYLAYALQVTGRLEDPTLAGVEDPLGRMQITEAQTAIQRVRETATVELAAALGVTAGFNALDGD